MLRIIDHSSLPLSVEPPDGDFVKGATSQAQAIRAAIRLFLEMLPESAASGGEGSTAHVTDVRLCHGQQDVAQWAMQQADNIRRHVAAGRYPVDRVLIGPIGMENWKGGHGSDAGFLSVLDYLAGPTAGTAKT